MKRKLFNSCLLLATLICVMGADSIGWGPGQPVPNPGGKGSTLEGGGPYAVDPANTFSDVYFNQQTPGTKLIGINKANAQNGQWNQTVTIAPGNYDTWGELFTLGPQKQINVSKTTIVNVNVK